MACPQEAGHPRPPPGGRTHDPQPMGPVAFECFKKPRQEGIQPPLWIANEKVSTIRQVTLN